jgi:hypothetical protein
MLSTTFPVKALWQWKTPIELISTPTLATIGRSCKIWLLWPPTSYRPYKGMVFLQKITSAVAKISGDPKEKNREKLRVLKFWDIRSERKAAKLSELARVVWTIQRNSTSNGSKIKLINFTEKRHINKDYTHKAMLDEFYLLGYNAV